MKARTNSRDVVYHSGTVDEETGPQHHPAGTPLQPRGAGRAYAAAVAKVNAELGGTQGWSPLPERMEQLRRGVAAPELYLGLGEHRYSG